MTITNQTKKPATYFLVTTFLPLTILVDVEVERKLPGPAPPPPPPNEVLEKDVNLTTETHAHYTGPVFIKKLK